MMKEDLGCVESWCKASVSNFFCYSRTIFHVNVFK